MGGLLWKFLLLVSADMVLCDKYHIIENKYIRVGVDLERGGAIGYLADSRTKQNVINCHDMGREVQMSFYAGPHFYNPGNKCNRLFNGAEWPWNPISAGDIRGHHSKILSLKQPSPTTLNVVTRPLQWACDYVPCDCLFEFKLELNGTGVHVKAILTNNRTDHTNYGPYGQELPATYTNGWLYRLFTYNGSAPWTKAPVVEYSTAPHVPWHPGSFPVTEHWAAMMDKEASYGMGVINTKATHFLGGFAGTPGSGGPHDNPTGYIAPTWRQALPWNIVFEYDFFLVLGNMDTIRAYAYEVQGHKYNN
eukprot:TRINITY_DN18765_c0_g1_i1.p1 TRINITY_DN18765_c0_g1~~TRINITY_DN18765_c0_g1_i1.p1  ORF type:complete len:306 (-),score=24.81 TRINITY_DN18765_c0_g1_i1:57-974(-)